MNLPNDEYEKCKSDPVYFAEKYLGYELLPWQKSYLKMYNKGQKLVWYGVRQGRTMVREILKEHNRLKEEE